MARFRRRGRRSHQGSRAERHRDPPAAARQCHRVLRTRPVLRYLVNLPDGVVAVVKRDCPTCQLVAPVLTQLRAAGVPLTVFSQDGPKFADNIDVVADDDLSVSWSLELDTVPTLVRI